MAYSDRTYVGPGPEWVTVFYVKPLHCNLCGNLNGSHTLVLYQSWSRSRSHISSVWLDHYTPRQQNNVVFLHFSSYNPSSLIAKYGSQIMRPKDVKQVGRIWYTRFLLQRVRSERVPTYNEQISLHWNHLRAIMPMLKSTFNVKRLLSKVLNLLLVFSRSQCKKKPFQSKTNHPLSRWSQGRGSLYG